MHRKGLSSAVLLVCTLAFAAGQATAQPSPAEARTIAKEAYIYGFPMVDNYRIEYAYFVDRNTRE